MKTRGTRRAKQSKSRESEQKKDVTALQTTRQSQRLREKNQSRNVEETNDHDQETRKNQESRKRKNKSEEDSQPPRKAIQQQKAQSPKNPPLKDQKSPKNQSSLEDQIQALYENVASAPAFSAKVAEYLRKNKIHSTHRRIVKKRFPRRRIIVDTKFKIFMGDLIVYKGYKFSNRHNVYILLIIDCFSRFVWTRPLKTKGKIDVANALNDIFQDLPEWPNSLITDEGLEFYNSNVKKILDRYGLHHYSIKTKMKASIAERAIQTIKKRLQLYMKTNKTKNWIDALPQIIKGYNSTPHRSIGMAPSQVTQENRARVFANLYPDIDLKVKPRLKIGNVVRKKIKKDIFEKGYTENWSEEIYVVADIRQRAGIVWYKIADEEGKRQPGIKYYFELNYVCEDIESLRDKKRVESA
ncbi:Oidioi.mRNA.OKI2018_I69.PAR.g13067.t1.cds [Oikopleura dioica]|uniref:Oidioi.mRNA.OKI2018_I69.PAR.g13067.t1.cds n=1 Tax=Oikopleura dioica TaxID=34765 RepID=A0ABN7S9W3_OIKDI|nr:Oidioi.mRNA.OKI2018_I69.PAR.g13067.t1.cds [Oikopleura dioica]